MSTLKIKTMEKPLFLVKTGWLHLYVVADDATQAIEAYYTYAQKVADETADSPASFNVRQEYHINSVERVAGEIALVNGTERPRHSRSSNAGVPSLEGHLMEETPKYRTAVYKVATFTVDKTHTHVQLECTELPASHQRAIGNGLPEDFWLHIEGTNTGIAIGDCYELRLTPKR